VRVPEVSRISVRKEIKSDGMKDLPKH